MVLVHYRTRDNIKLWMTYTIRFALLSQGERLDKLGLYVTAKK